MSKVTVVGAGNVGATCANARKNNKINLRSFLSP